MHWGRLLELWPVLPVLLVLFAAPAGVCVAAPDVSAGERIYREGVLPSGAPLRGSRRQSGDGEGAAIACVNCHRRSGLGGGEGTIRIAPLTSKYLFNRSGVQAGRPTLDAAAASDASRAAYDDASLAAAIRSGVGRGARELNYLMPRYKLDDAGMAALIAYLRSLPTAPSPGVSDGTIEFATVFTPDADPKVREGVLAVLNQFIADKNAFQRGGAKPLRSEGQIDYRVTRRWQLHVWTLNGPPAGWDDQLRRFLAAEPVFAVLSGVGGRDWEPVHHFCEAARLPCLFPNAAIPVDDERDFYTIYLSKGALLESELIAARLAMSSGKGRLVQLYPRVDIGERAAARLQALAPTTFEPIMRPVAHGDAAAIAKAVGEVGPGDVLVLWLGPTDLALLGPPPEAAAAVYLSGSLAGFEHAPLSPAWRAVAQATYPVDLPEARAVRMNYPLRWFQIRHVPVVDEKVQTDTYLACGIVAEALNEMLDNFMRDYLVERIESMVSHRQLSGYYPHLGLAPGQRFASKGGYIVRFTESGGLAIAPTTEWTVPDVVRESR
jgi:cytochrome c553